MSTLAELEIVSVERIDGREVIVEFSDRTIARYTTQMLAGMQPDRPCGNEQPETSASNQP